MRGNAKADIFETDEHRWHFLDLLGRYKVECEFELLAWCLMDNHVHLLISAEDIDVSAALQRLATAYAVYYNKLEERVGHLFQSPFRSKPIEYEEQLINTIRYIHRNPERAGICPADEYVWSSYGEYANEPWLINDSIALGIAGGKDELLNGIIDPLCVVREKRQKLTMTDGEARQMIANRIGLNASQDLMKLTKVRRNAIIREFSVLGLPATQLARLFGLGERTVYRIVANASKRYGPRMTPLAKGV